MSSQRYTGVVVSVTLGDGQGCGGFIGKNTTTKEGGSVCRLVTFRDILLKGCDVEGGIIEEGMKFSFEVIQIGTSRSFRAINVRRVADALKYAEARRCILDAIRPMLFAESSTGESALNRMIRYIRTIQDNGLELTEVRDHLVRFVDELFDAATADQLLPWLNGEWEPPVTQNNR